MSRETERGVAAANATESVRGPVHALPVMALRKDASGALDDVVAEDVTRFRAEIMDGRSLWMACYFANGERVAFWVTANLSRLTFSATEIPAYSDFDGEPLAVDRMWGVFYGEELVRVVPDGDLNLDDLAEDEYARVVTADEIAQRTPAAESQLFPVDPGVSGGVGS